MSVTVTQLSAGTGPGAGGSRPIFMRADRAMEVVLLTVAMDSSYPTGGEAFNAETQSGLSDIVQVWVNPTAGLTFEYVDSATAASRKIIAYWVDTSTDGAALAEVADQTDLATVVANVMVIGYR